MTSQRIFRVLSMALGALVALPAFPADSPLAPASAINRSNEGFILYSRLESQAGGVAVQKIFTMTADGQKQSPFINPKGGELNFVEARQPQFSPDYKTLTFTSNFESAKSALFTDVFTLDLASGKVVRVSGNEWSAGNVKRTGTVYGIVQIGMTDVAPNAVNVAVQGMNGKIYRLSAQMTNSQGQTQTGQYTYVIENVPAGKVWVKSWHSRHKGDLKFVDVAADKQTVVDTMHLADGNWLATNPSLSPDGKYMAVLSQHAYYVNSINTGNPGDPQGVKEQGFDSVSLLDLTKAGQAVFMWEPTKMSGQNAKDPKFSPDGKSVAFTCGNMPAESVSIMSLDSMLKGTPQVKTVAAGQQMLGVGAVACSQPAWSPDGKKIAFIRAQSDLNMNFTGNVCVVNIDGTGLTQVSRVAGNQCVVNPCWSPDGKKIAAGVIVSKRAQLNALDLLGLNITCDVWTINLDGSNPTQLTRDGKSSEPAWGK